MNSTPMKRCTKCGEEKPATLEFFTAAKTGKYGVRGDCRDCEKAARRASYDRKYPVDPEGQRTCKTCGVLKPLDDQHFECVDAEKGWFYRDCLECATPRRQAMRAALRGREPKAPAPTRTCTKCGCFSENPIEDFYANPSARDGLTRQCKKCISEANKTYREENAEALAEYGRTWRAENIAYRRDYALNNRDKARRQAGERRRKTPIKHRCAVQNRRALRLGIPGIITQEDVFAQLATQSHQCFYCDEPLEGVHFDIEHVIPLSRKELNPTNMAENIVCACGTCNANKRSRTPEEWVVRWYLSQKSK